MCTLRVDLYAVLHYVYTTFVVLTTRNVTHTYLAVYTHYMMTEIVPFLEALLTYNNNKSKHKGYVLPLTASTPSMYAIYHKAYMLTQCHACHVYCYGITFTIMYFYYLVICFM